MITVQSVSTAERTGIEEGDEGGKKRAKGNKSLKRVCSGQWGAGEGKTKVIIQNVHT